MTRHRHSLVVVDRNSTTAARHLIATFDHLTPRVFIVLQEDRSSLVLTALFSRILFVPATARNQLTSRDRANSRGRVQLALYVRLSKLSS